jgi:drug/metabolite transporter (DMT)-like permease
VSSFVIAAVLFAALLHATWNALVKAREDKLFAATLVAIGAGIVALPCIAFLPLPAPAAWPYLVASSVIHVGYFALVAYAYRAADLGVAYPLTRGTAPPLTAVLAWLFVGEALGWKGWLAVLAIALGVVALSAEALLRGGLTRATAIATFANAGVIVLYTLIDGLGARAAGNPFSYVAWMLAGTAVMLFAAMLWKRGTAFARKLTTSLPFAIGAGGISLFSYAIALWAMTLAPIGLVAALRETSMMFAALLGALLFNEAFGPRRWLALCLIVFGVIALR